MAFSFAPFGEGDKGGEVYTIHHITHRLHTKQLDNKHVGMLSLDTGFKAKICRSGPSLEAVIFLVELSGGKKSEK